MVSGVPQPDPMSPTRKVASPAVATVGLAGVLSTRTHSPAKLGWDWAVAGATLRQRRVKTNRMGSGMSSDATMTGEGSRAVAGGARRWGEARDRPRHGNVGPRRAPFARPASVKCAQGPGARTRVSPPARHTACGIGAGPAQPRSRAPQRVRLASANNPGISLSVPSTA